MASHQRRPITLLDLPAIRFPLEYPLARELAADYWVACGRKRAKPLVLAEVRSAILREAIQVTEEMSPRLHGVVREALRNLRVERPFQVFQRADLLGFGNNAAVVDEVDDTILITTVGRLLTDFDDDSLLAVIGHEVGHHIAHGNRFRRTIPRVGLVSADLMSTSPRTRKAAPAFMMSTELTADRFGLLACQDLEAALRVEMLFVAGLDASALTWSTKGYLRQCQELMENHLDRGETVLGHTHPEHSFRAYAVWMFSESDAYARLTGQGPGFLSIASVNATLRRLVMPKGLTLKAPDDTPPPAIKPRVSPIPRSRLARAARAKKRTRPPVGK
jgi:hypothetical protein